ncbi:MAG: DNA-3-methyladenine glycosylase 2 family protein [Acidobacteria bacterium]|nr:DNA-3-methyladenine glycosylase 2 family protein [Acidobacteriota bacterium]
MAKRYWRPRTAVRELSRRDPRFAALVAKVGQPSVELRESTFGAIARAIAYQQLAGSAASAIWGRALALFPDGEALDPAAFLRKRDSTYRKVGLSGAKTKSIKDLARHITRGDFDPADFHEQSNEEVTDALTQVWGIGEWSAQMHLMFSLGRLDVWPVLDLGVRNGWAKFQGGPPPTAKALIPLGEPYRPYRSVVAWYMWRVHDVEDWSGPAGPVL